MFDIGFGELLLIAVVALVVLGPERLPKAARFAGLWVRRARAQWHSVKAELERELEAEELKRSLQDTQAALKQAQTRLQDELGQAQAGVREGLDSAGRQLDEVRRQVEDRPPAAVAGAADANADAASAAAEATPPAASGANPNTEPDRDDEPRRP
jgi:sec-independent protein translocase protein TatB